MQIALLVPSYLKLPHARQLVGMKNLITGEEKYLAPDLLGLRDGG
jgi:hypothetical protein